MLAAASPQLETVMKAPPENKPAIVEAAISPLRWDVPAQSSDEMASEAKACIAAGAGIIHHHHDMRLDEAAATRQLIDTARAILDAYPDTLIYTDYLAGKGVEVEYAHVQPMHEAGVLTMLAVDPGITTFPSEDRSGLLTRTHTDGLTFEQSHQMIGVSKAVDIPVSLGVFEPGHLRWIVKYARKTGFSSGSIIKLYFGGSRRVDLPGAEGLNFGLPPTREALDVYLSMMEGCDLPWIVSVFGDPILDTPLARYALEKGGHVRLGLEDAAIETSMTSADMVAEGVALARAVGRPVVTGADALTALRAG